MMRLISIVFELIEDISAKYHWWKHRRRYRRKFGAKWIRAAH